jgi:hypothetical protein
MSTPTSSRRRGHTSKDSKESLQVDPVDTTPASEKSGVKTASDAAPHAVSGEEAQKAGVPSKSSGSDATGSTPTGTEKATGSADNLGSQTGPAPTTSEKLKEAGNTEGTPEGALKDIPVPQVPTPLSDEDDVARVPAEVSGATPGAPQSTAGRVSVIPAESTAKAAASGPITDAQSIHHSTTLESLNNVPNARPVGSGGVVAPTIGGIQRKVAEVQISDAKQEFQAIGDIKPPSAAQILQTLPKVQDVQGLADFQSIQPPVDPALAGATHAVPQTAVQVDRDFQNIGDNKPIRAVKSIRDIEPVNKAEASSTSSSAQSGGQESSSSEQTEEIPEGLLKKVAKIVNKAEYYRVFYTDGSVKEFYHSTYGDAKQALAAAYGQ